jgi:hypothetical protein
MKKSKSKFYFAPNVLPILKMLSVNLFRDLEEAIWTLKMQEALCDPVKNTESRLGHLNLGIFPAANEWLTLENLDQSQRREF